MDPVFLNLERLRDRRLHVEDDEEIAAATKTIASDRNGCIRKPLLSVCDKDQLAPSGDPHDFLSIPTYLWPDPSTPDGLPWIHRDGQVNPAATRTDAGRYFKLVDTIEVLALSAWYRGDQDAATKVIELIKTWFIDEGTRMNPALDYAQHKPGEEHGTHWGVIDLQRTYYVLDLLAIVRESGLATLDDEDLASLQRWCAALRDWILTSEAGRDECSQIGNHGVWCDAQIVAYSLFTGDPQMVRTHLEEVTTPRLMKAIEPDGNQPREVRRATPIEYAVFNLFGYAVVAEMGLSAGIDLWRGDPQVTARIVAALDWLQPYLTAQLPISRISKHRGTFTVGAEATMLLRIAAERLDSPQYLDVLSQWVLHRPASRENLVIPATPEEAAFPKTRRNLTELPVERPPIGPPPAGPAKRRLRDRVRSLRGGAVTAAPPIAEPAPTAPASSTYQKAFVVGCPRSGTIWALDILRRHGLTIVGPESHLFSQLFVPATLDGTTAERRRRTLETYDSSAARLGARGPQQWIDRDDLARALEELGDGSDADGMRVVEAALDAYFVANHGRPADVLVEKTPDHVHWADRILAYWPDAKIVEVVRDGRDVVTSLGHTSWAPADRRLQAQKWVDAIETGKRIRESPAAAGRWHVLRYEDLKESTYREITRLLDFLDLTWDDSLIRDIVAETDIVHMPPSRREEQHRLGVVGSWRTELTDDEIAIVEEVAGPTLAAAGYETR